MKGGQKLAWGFPAHLEVGVEPESLGGALLPNPESSRA